MLKPKLKKPRLKTAKKSLAEAKENCEVVKASQEIAEWWKVRLEKNIEELRKSKERCFEKSLDCVKNLKNSFAKVGAYSSDENFIRADPKALLSG
jgi:hypothetical protein